MLIGFKKVFGLKAEPENAALVAGTPTGMVAEAVSFVDKP